MTPEELNKKGDNYYEAEDYIAAMEWFRKAAAQGDKNAKHNLKVLYDAGKISSASY